MSAIGDWHTPALGDASAHEPPPVVDNTAALAGLKVVPAFAAAGEKPLPGNLAAWRAFSSGSDRPSREVPAAVGTLDQLARVLLLAKLTGVGQAADYALAQSLGSARPLQLAVSLRFSP